MFPAESIFPAGITINQNFYFVFNGNLYVLRKGNNPTFWTNKFLIGQPSSTPLRLHDCLTQLNNNNIFTVANDNNLWEYNIEENKWISHGRPASNVACVSPSGAPMYNSTIHVAGNNGNLYSRKKTGNTWAWINRSKPSGYIFDMVSVPIKIADGKLFISGFKSTILGPQRKLFELKSFLGSWTWVDHGRPDTNCAAVGAAMNENKIFVAGANGKVYERYWNSGQWLWADHGTIRQGGGISSMPEKINNDKFFIATFESDTKLQERYFHNSSNSWIWNDHGGLSEYKIVSGPSYANEYPDRMFFISKHKTSSNYLIHSIYWDGNLWTFFNHGII